MKSKYSFNTRIATILFFSLISPAAYSDELTDSILQPKTSPTLVSIEQTTSISDMNQGHNQQNPQCSKHSWAQVVPQITIPQMTVNTQLICYDEFSLNYSGVSKTPLWVTQHLTKARLTKARQLKRVNRFHVESQLPFEWQSQLADFRDPKYDRGHMAPSGDMSTRQAQYQSFSLANIVPQEGRNNRETWADIERAVRVMAEQQDEVYIVTGPVFATDEVDTLNDVMIPTHFYKAVYLPKKNIASVYLSANQPGRQVKIISLKELDQVAAIKTFPTLDDNIRAKKVWLPLNANAALKWSSNPFQFKSPNVPKSINPFKMTQKTVQSLLKEMMLP